MRVAAVQFESLPGDKNGKFLKIENFVNKPPRKVCAWLFFRNVASLAIASATFRSSN